MSETRARSGTRREEILDAAARLFAERGYHGVSIDDIGSAVGMSGPGIYRHFAGKEDVLSQMLLRISHELLEEGSRRVVAAASASDALDVEEWVTVLSEVLPGVPQARLRTATHAAFGLLNSTPYTIGKHGDSELATEPMAGLLYAMAHAALLAAAR